MKHILLAIAGVILSSGIEQSAAIQSYPYFTVTPQKGRLVKAIGGNAEFEPLETSTMKTLPTLRDMKRNLVTDGFKPEFEGPDSITERIKGASRSHSQW